MLPGIIISQYRVGNVQKHVDIMPTPDANNERLATNQSAADSENQNAANSCLHTIHVSPYPLRGYGPVVPNVWVIRSGVRTPSLRRGPMGDREEDEEIGIGAGIRVGYWLLMVGWLVVDGDRKATDKLPLASPDP